ncbi:MAG: hypothetical protein HY842_12715 [Bacteroidetes bacterium]|nr:hypothetical protein [Bacteroidota bacterium]
MENKFALLAGFALCLLFAHCKNGPTPASDAATTAVTPFEKLEGYWVNDDWWKELQSSKSPLKASKKSGIAAAIIRPDGSRWIADMSFGWHEGGQYALREREGKLSLYNPQDANVQPIALEMQHDGYIRLDSFPMVRLGDGLTGFNVIASTILGGAYEWMGKQVAFNPNGTVVGLDDYYRYELALDYMADELGADQLMLSKEGKTPDIYAFKIDGNRLVVSSQEDMGSKDAFQYKVGKVKYELEKQ